MSSVFKGILSGVTIIIPVADNETELDNLLDDLKDIDADIIISSEGSRAKSMNKAVKQAQGNFLWFLHADSRVTKDNILLLRQALENKPHYMHYFDLCFDGDGITTVNVWGANMRSRVIGLPFGDQGLCIAKELFDEIGGFPEDARQGEDLLFVWKARQSGVKLNRIKSRLLTSSRKYQTQGWLKLTLKYQWCWISMSIPQIYKLFKSKLFKI